MNWIVVCVCVCLCGYLGF